MKFFRNRSGEINKSKIALISLLAVQGTLAFLFVGNYRLTTSVKYLKNLNISKISNYLKDLTTSYDWDNQIKRVDISINYKNIVNLNCLRQRKDNCDNLWSKAKLESEGKVYKIKLRAKGDREIHRDNFKRMSFKIDIRGRERYRGMEEFSIQLPVARNYTHELLAADIMKENKIITPNHFYVKLYVNGEYYGIRHLEESLAREVVERSSKRYGPIYSLQEDISTIFEDSKIDTHDLRSWKRSNSSIYKDGLTILTLGQNDPQIIKRFFDSEAWANYFALIDVMWVHHASLEKSVKFYLNPTTGLFEPIFYDGHFHPRFILEDFLLGDFVQEDKYINCDWLCVNKYWYTSFFGDYNNVDVKFYSNYLNALEKYSSKDYYEKIIEKKYKLLSPIRGSIYREFHRTDAIDIVGIFPHINSQDFLKKRINSIRKKIQKVRNDMPLVLLNKKNNKISFLNTTSRMPQVLQVECKKNRSEPLILVKHISVESDLNNLQCENEDIFFSLDNFKTKINLLKLKDPTGNQELFNKLKTKKIDLPLQKKDNTKTYFKFDAGLNSINDDLTLVNKKIVIDSLTNICINNGSKLFIINSEIIGKKPNSKLIIDGCNKKSGSLIIKDSSVNLSQLEVGNLIQPELPLMVLYGGLNFINSIINLDGLFISSSLSEDGVNFIDSNVKIRSLRASQTLSDAIDSDYSNLKINSIDCDSIGNDCLDISYSNVNIKSLTGEGVGDKVVSAGESSSLKIDSLKSLNSEIGLVVKDSSIAKVGNYFISNNKLPIATYIKKPELGTPTLLIETLDYKYLNKSLISNDSVVKISNQNFIGKLDSISINNMLYGKMYGKKTER